MTNFHDLYIGYKKEELFQIILSSNDYQPDAIIAAREVIKKNNWENDLKKILEEQKIKNKATQLQYEQDVAEKAEYYKNLVEFKNQKNSFEVRIADTPKFEGSLAEKNIEFFREDKNIGVQLDSYPTQTYYFKNEDVEQVDQITQELNLITVPYADYKPFFKFEIKVLVIVLVLVALLILIFN